MAEGKLCLFVMVAIIVSCALWEVEAFDETLCHHMERCEQCIVANSQCAWCSDETFSSVGNIRCSSQDDLINRRCINITNPGNVNQTKKNESVFDGDTARDPIQLQPQHIALKLRPGAKQVVDVKFRVAANLPIDLYFVLDFTFSMRSRLHQLANLTSTLIHGLKQFTKNVYLGFGSFLDKPVTPFLITTEKLLNNPCFLDKQNCSSSYSFKHRRELSPDIQPFIDAIRNGETSSNYDPMEGGLDGILQAAVCDNIIGWRTASRRVLVYVSDSGFHFAGDGKLAGINMPNDGECHLSVNRQGDYDYTMDLTQDYPSMGQLAEILDKHRINTFFVVDPQTKGIYEGLSDELKLAQTAFLTDDGTDMVRNIKEYNQKLSEKVTMKVYDQPSELNVTVKSACTGRVTDTTNTCEGLDIGDAVTFEIHLEAKHCPKNASAKHTLTVRPVGLQEQLTIDVEYICDCDCETSTEKDNEFCHYGNGTYLCGVCKCNEGRTGKTCQCEMNEQGTIKNEEYEQMCIDNTTEPFINAPCRGKGDCECGLCRNCVGKYTGAFCQCYSGKCSDEGGELCGGPDKGVCNCETCECINGYTGRFCDCAPESRCLNNGLVCSGKGTCSCGVCSCNSGYGGALCETCTTCDDGGCSRCSYQDCVKCLARADVGQNGTALCSGVCPRYINEVTTFANLTNDDEPCGLFDDNECRIDFLVTCDNIDGQELQYLWISMEKRCPNPPNALLIAMPLLAGIIGVGILLLTIWKLLTSFYDRIEYARFSHETQNPKWSKVDNPIYNSPVTSNQNPMYQPTVD